MAVGVGSEDEIVRALDEGQQRLSGMSGAESMQATLHIRLLGDFRVAAGDAPLTSLNTPRLQALLAYLLLHRDSPQSRQHIAFLFWLDSSEDQALANLRNLVFQLRHALTNADLFLLTDGRTLQWNPQAPFTLDVAEFQRALDTAIEAERQGDASSTQHLKHAVELYKGDLLPNCYDEWILPEREALHNQYTLTLKRLVAISEAQRDYRTAIEYCQQLLHSDPLSESAYRDLMRLYALSGDRARALHTYHACSTLLARELGVEPGPATHEAYKSLLKLDIQPTATKTERGAEFAAATSLVGRRYEWSQLQAAWHSATEGRPEVVLLAGEAGIGKTRLAQELLDWAERQGVATATSRCYASEGTLPLSPVVGWLRPRSLRQLEPLWLSELSRLLPELLVQRPELPAPGPLTEAWQRIRLFEALSKGVLAGSQPLLLLLDDVQWADRDTLEWLRYFMRYDERACILVVLTLRLEELDPADQTGPLHTLLHDLRRSGQLRELELQPLSAAETATLASGVAGREVDADAQSRIYSETEGNPLFVVETIRAGLGTLVESDTGQSRNQDSAGTLVPPLARRRLPAAIEAVITTRLSKLSPAAQDLAALAAVVGREFTFAALQAATGVGTRSEYEIVRALDELWRRRIVREAGDDAYDFSHDKLREVAYTRLSAAHKKLLHRKVAQALETIYPARSDNVSGQIADHYERAGLPIQAIPYYRRSADAAARVYANEEAISYYRRVLDLLNKLPDSAKTKEEGVQGIGPAEMYEALGDILQLTGRYEEALAALEAAKEQAPHVSRAGGRVTQARLNRKIGNTLSSQNRYPEAMQAYRAAEEALGLQPDGQDDSQDVELWRAWCDIQLAIGDFYYYIRADADSLERLITTARPVVERYGTARHAADLFRELGQLNYRRNRYVISKEDLTDEQAELTAAEKTGDLNLIAGSNFRQGFRRLWYGDFAAAEESLQTALRMAKQTGDHDRQMLCLTYLVIVNRKQGLFTETRLYVELALDAATIVGSRYYIGAARANLSWLALQEGDLQAAEQHGREALQVWEGGNYPFTWLAIFPLASVLLQQDQPEEAIGYLCRLLNPVQQRMPASIEQTIEALAVASDSNRLDEALNLAKKAVELGRELGYL